MHSVTSNAVANILNFSAVSSEQDIRALNANRTAFLTILKVSQNITFNGSSIMVARYSKGIYFKAKSNDAIAIFITPAAEVICVYIDANGSNTVRKI